jgi:hypothetical protein
VSDPGGRKGAIASFLDATSVEKPTAYRRLNKCSRVSGPRPTERRATMSFSQFKVLTFDVVGTLIDFETGLLVSVRAISRAWPSY